MLFSPASHNGYKVLKKCFKVLMTSPIALFLCLCIIASTTLIFGSIIYAEYHYYGVSVFNSDTFFKLLDLEFKEHLFKICLFLCALFLSFFINNIFIVALTFYYIKKLNKQRYSFFLVLKWISSKVFHISHIAIILVIAFLNTLLYALHPKTTTEHILAFLQNQNSSSDNTMDNWENALLLPLMVTSDNDIPSTIKESTKLIQKTFGNNFTVMISFVWIKISIISLILGTFGFFIHYHYNLLSALIGSFFLILIGFILLENTILLFKVCLYSYIIHQKPQPFTTKEITSYFIQGS